MKKSIITTLMAIALLMQIGTAPAAHAGKKERRLLQGAIIGTGAVILGTAIASGLNDHDNRNGVYKRPGHHHSPKEYVQPYRKPHWKDREGHQRRPHHIEPINHPKRGHWRINKVWIEPKYAKRWNPGHYNKRGHWVDGKYQNIIVCEGHWEKKRVWVSRW